MYNGFRSTLHSDTQLQALEKLFASKFASLVKHLAISLLKTSPTAIGQTPPFFFNKADNDALQRAREKNSGSSPRQIMFTSLVSNLKTNCDSSEAVYCTACERCSGNIFEGPAAVNLENEFSCSETFSSLN